MAVRKTVCLICLISLCGSPAFSSPAAKRKPAPSRAAAAKTPTTAALPKRPPAANSAPTQKQPTASQTPPPTTPSADDRAPQAGQKAYKLRYKFKPGETIRWQVEHEATVRSTVQGTTQTAETQSRSVKVWKIQSVDDNGNTTLAHSVERVEMKQKFDGRKEVHYDSETDTTPPAGFEHVAKAVGVTLATLTLDPLGKLIEREENYVQAAPQQENITLPLPEQAVSTGEEWTMPADIVVTIPSGESRSTKTIKARQLYRLESVDDGVAAIRIETQILTPVNDPKIESQLVQSKSNGLVRFDLAAGRIVGQESEVDEHVHGFQDPGSSLHYVTQFSEKLLPATDGAALYPQAPKRR